MFGKKEIVASQPSSSKADTHIGEGIVFKDGSITGIGSVRIDGVVFGNIDIDGLLRIGDSGSVIGNVRTNEVIVEGIIEGNIFSHNTIKISSSGKVSGDLSCQSLEIAAGASFIGSCDMGENIRRSIPIRTDRADESADQDLIESHDSEKKAKVFSINQ